MPTARNPPSRPHVEAARIGKITQGTVFNCAVAFRYPGKQVFGLTITARCDVAQEKYRLLNYVPVVPLRDWLMVDGLEILTEIERKDRNGKIRSELTQNGLSSNLMLSVSLREIIDTHFPEKASEKGIIKTRKRLEKCKHEADELFALEGNPEGRFAWFLNNRSKMVSNIVSDLFNHKVLGYYFLERLSPNSVLEGFVGLLREVSSLPREVAEELANGLSKARWDEVATRVGANSLGHRLIISQPDAD